MKIIKSASCCSWTSTKYINLSISLPHLMETSCFWNFSFMLNLFPNVGWKIESPKVIKTNFSFINTLSSTENIEMFSNNYLWMCNSRWWNWRSFSFFGVFPCAVAINFDVINIRINWCSCNVFTTENDDSWMFKFQTFTWLSRGNSMWGSRNDYFLILYFNLSPGCFVLIFGFHKTFVYLLIN